MKKNSNSLISEWFYRLPNGYATIPYTESELNVLEQVLKENGITNWKGIIQHMKEADVATQEPDDSELQPETHESNEDFRNLLDSFEQFSDILNKRYITPGIQIVGLEDLYNELIALPDSIKIHIRKIIGKRTNRDIFYGTFKMGQYEKLLLDVIERTIKINNIKNEVLWFAIVLDGKLKPNALDTSVLTGDVIVNESNVQIGKFNNEIISFGIIDPEIASLLTVLDNLGEVINGSKLNEYTKDSINNLLSSISDESNKQEIEQFLNLSNISKLSALKSLSNNIKAALENHDINELPIKFCSLIDQFISKVLSQVSYWGTISGDMVYITTGQSLFPSLNCTKEGRLGGGIYGIQDNKLRVLGDIIHDKLE